MPVQPWQWQLALCGLANSVFDQLLPLPFPLLLLRHRMLWDSLGTYTAWMYKGVNTQWGQDIRQWWAGQQVLPSVSFL